jgi:hypothetical protein
MRHRRELTEEAAQREIERERELLRERRREHRLDMRMLTVADVETLIAAALAVERQAVIPAERDHHKSELLRTRGLELAMAKLESALAQMTLATTERGKVVDLPNPMRAVN